MTNLPQRPGVPAPSATEGLALRTGVAYLGHHNPRHMRTDLAALAGLDCDDVLLAVQEIDFDHFPGKFRALPPIAEDLGLWPVAIRECGHSGQ